MTKTLLRSAIAAIIGIVVAFGLIWLAQYAGSEISPDVYDPNSGEILIPVGSTIALIVGWFIGTFARSEEHTSELQSLMRISYAVFCLTKKHTHNIAHPRNPRHTTRYKKQTSRHI